MNLRIKNLGLDLTTTVASALLLPFAAVGAISIIGTLTDYYGNSIKGARPSRRSHGDTNNCRWFVDSDKVPTIKTKQEEEITC